MVLVETPRRFRASMEPHEPYEFRIAIPNKLRNFIYLAMPLSMTWHGVCSDG